MFKLGYMCASPHHIFDLQAAFLFLKLCYETPINSVISYFLINIYDFCALFEVFDPQHETTLFTIQYAFSNLFHGLSQENFKLNANMLMRKYEVTEFHEGGVSSQIL